MPESVARIATDRADRYVKQLASHFGHKVPVVQEGRQIEILFDLGVAMCTASSRGITVTVQAHRESDVAEVQGIITRHLEAFGQRDELRVSWTPTIDA
ncbi:DUF2218 domain-containing protein [Lolliginicoccus suaedae]|uniref:DUF2218 domain-containing protein n=1 Tax=Lolliginicoccus suaedae TaxID=2605429 RepID=UPI0011ED5F7F|nr:DUF2218 domain-containing protein [Lolliginicoccus suaedae]